MSIVDVSRSVTGGVDTHRDAHVVAALDGIGGLVGTAEFEANPAGYRRLFSWLCTYGEVGRVGVEGTGSYGAGLARHLIAQGVEVVEVDRPNRQMRRRRGKSDPVDAVAAARAALSGIDIAVPKTRSGNVEAIRALLVAKRSMQSQIIECRCQLRHLVFTAPDDIRGGFDGLDARQVAERAYGFKPRETNPDPVDFATRFAMRELGRRIKDLRAEKHRLDRRLRPLVRQTAPELAAMNGVGTDTAATLLVVAGDNPDRIRNEAAWARICGAAPIEASSGQVVRHRLDRGGDRRGNSALFRIVLSRMSGDKRTQAYVARRRAAGRSTPEIMRSLKRYVAREVYKHLPHNIDRARGLKM